MEDKQKRENQRSMHLLYVQQLLMLPGYAGNTRSFDISKQLIQSGHSVSIITSAAQLKESHYLPYNARFPYRFEFEGINIIVLKVPYAHKMSFVRRIWAFLSFLFKAYQYGKKIEEIDAIMAYSPPLSSGIVGKKLADYHQKPLIFEVADVWPDVPIGMGIIPFAPLQKILLKTSMKIYSKAALIFPFSNDMREQISQKGVSTDKIRVLENGINLPERPLLRKKSEKGENQVKLIYAGTVGIANGIDQILMAWEKLSEYSLSAQLTIIGEGNRLKRIKRLATKKELKDIIFLPHVKPEDLSSLLPEFHIGIGSFAPFPVLEANGSAKFFDYLASGLPVVINYQGWQGKLLENEKCGLSSKQGNLEEFVSNLKLLIEDHSLRNEMGKRAYELAWNKYDRKILANHMLEDLEKLISP